MARHKTKVFGKLSLCKLRYRLALYFISSFLCSLHGQTAPVTGSDPFVKSGSFTLQYNGHLQLMDISESDGKLSFLAFDGESKTILEFNHHGELVNQVDSKDPKLRLQGKSVASLAIIGNNLRFIKSEISYNLYDSNWRFLKSTPRVNTWKGPYLRTIERKPLVFDFNGHHILIEAKAELKPDEVYSHDFFMSSKILYWVDLSVSKLDSIISFPKQSMYLSETHFYPRFTPFASINEHKGILNVLLPLERTLYRYDYQNKLRPQESFDLNFGLPKSEGLLFEDQRKDFNPAFGMGKEVLNILRKGLGINYSFAMGDHIFIEYSTISPGGKKQNRMVVTSQGKLSSNFILPKSSGRSKTIYLKGGRFVRCAAKDDQHAKNGITFNLYSIQNF
ncbi:MAG: hypothetical protein HEP71_09885 [Roseivirga sp.]|nr:hypothetical protein [Roseivirga sp.]